MIDTLTYWVSRLHHSTIQAADRVLLHAYKDVEIQINRHADVVVTKQSLDHYRGILLGRLRSQGCNTTIVIHVGRR